ncbi:MAG: hypothetical protein CML39_01595 [Rhodobacteraceae bacterium]|nr:MAG: hypothetical protein CML39_01595 [Paracoccaceae bacterium]
MKKALLTTTALVALSGAAFADSIDAVVAGGTSHHTHSAATVEFHGDANIKYNVPLVLGGNKADGVVSSDVDLDVTMTSPGSYSATVSYGMEGNAIAGATVSVTTPIFNVSVGTIDARGGANGGADASDLYADIDHMTGIGADEDSSDWYVALPNFGGWTVAASGKANMTTTADKEKTSIGLTGSVGGLSITAGGMHKSGGASVSTALMGATVKVAMASIHNGTKAVSETGVQVDIPLGGMSLSVNSTQTDGNNNWGASVSTTVAGFAISAGTDSDTDSQFKIAGPMGPVSLHIDWDSSDSALTTATDATIEAGVTYAVPGTKGTSISASYSNDDDDFDAGTQVKMAFKF